MMILRRIFNNRYYIITKHLEKESTSMRDSDIVAVTQEDLLSLCRSNIVMELPNHFDAEKIPKDLNLILYHVAEGRKQMLLKQHYNEPPEE